jgi:hypothetical protein
VLGIQKLEPLSENLGQLIQSPGQTSWRDRKHGIAYEVSDKNRSQLYLELIPALSSKRVELLDHRGLINELRRLERRRGRSGKDSIDHPAQLSDDMANSVAGVVNLVIAKPPMSSDAIPTGAGNIKRPFGNALEQPPFEPISGSSGFSRGGRNYSERDDDEPPAKVHEVSDFRGVGETMSKAKN